MSKKNWIMIKRGLSQDPKHRETIGQAIWCFMHIIDRADWDTGTVYDWRDKDEAEDMGVNVRTLRDWRQSLDKSDYITCQQKQYGQEIIIHNWINPRNYSGELLNPQGDRKTVPQGDTQDDTQGTPQGDTQGVRKRVTPTYSSGNQVSGINKRPTQSERLAEAKERKAKQQAERDERDPVLEFAKMSENVPVGKRWPHREKFPEAIRELLDVYVKLTGQHPSKDKVMDWLTAGQDWLDLGIIRQDIEHAHQKSRGDEKGYGGFTVGRPGSLTNTANMFAGERRVGNVDNAPKINTAAIEETKRRLEEREKKKFVPPPETIRKLTKQLSKGVQS